MGDIRGTTRLFAVLGDPVDQVRAPQLLNPLFTRLGLDAVLVPAHVPPDGLGAAVRGLQGLANLDGLLVTVPHKVAICRHVDALSSVATVSGSANALRREPDGRWYADNFDGAGFVRGLERAGRPVRGQRFTVVGAGGAGAALAAALLRSEAAHVRLCDPDTHRLREVLARLEPTWPGRTTGTPEPRVADADATVNATPLGMRPADPLPFDPGALPPGCLVADIVMKPPETRLLRTAAALGHPVHHGSHMLDQQLDLYRDFFALP